MTINLIDDPKLFFFILYLSAFNVSPLKLTLYWALYISPHRIEYTLSRRFVISVHHLRFASVHAALVSLLVLPSISTYRW